MLHLLDNLSTYSISHINFATEEPVMIIKDSQQPRKYINHLLCQNKKAILDCTFNASFLSLFIALNCFILDSTALSIGLSDASPIRSHGCSVETSTKSAKYYTSKQNLNATCKKKILKKKKKEKLQASNASCFQSKT